VILLSSIDRGLYRLYRLCGFLAAIFLVTLGLLVLASIVSRLFGVYLPGVAEYSGYAMAAASFLALAYTFGEGGHIRVELVLSRLAPGPRRVFELWCLGVASAVGVYLAWFMVRLAWTSWRFEERSEGSDAILIWMPQAPVALGAVLFAICLVHALLHRVYGPHPAPAKSDLD
jgi:TRAP-type C4-dicarboxylate transport system permease small subunit